jgi:hypothetical protein
VKYETLTSLGLPGKLLKKYPVFRNLVLFGLCCDIGVRIFKRLSKSISTRRQS